MSRKRERQQVRRNGALDSIIREGELELTHSNQCSTIGQKIEGNSAADAIMRDLEHDTTLNSLIEGVEEVLRERAGQGVLTHIEARMVIL